MSSKTSTPSPMGNLLMKPSDLYLGKFPFGDADRDTNLKVRSVVRLHKLATIHRSSLVRLDGARRLHPRRAQAGISRRLSSARSGYGAAGDASAPRDTRRCRFFPCTNATGRKPRRVREQDAGRKPAATGRQGAGGAKAGGAKAKAQVGNLRLRVGRKGSPQVGKPAATLLRPVLPSFALRRFPAGCCPESACTC